MTAKERPSPATLPALPTNGHHAESHPVRAAALAWEDWFRQATAAQQTEALALAQRQGYVGILQLPAPANGAKPHCPSASSDGLEILRSILAGKIDALPLAAPPALASGSSHVTQLQQRAARRMLGSPDVALLRAKSNAAAVVAEAIVQASRAGQRVLLLAHQTASLDAILLQLVRRDAVLPIRFLDAGETVGQLAAPIRALTLDAQRQLFQTKTLIQAQTGRTAAEDRCRRRRSQEPLWPQLAQLAEQHAALEEKRQSLLHRIAAAPAEVRREAEGVPNSGKTLPSGPFALQVVELIKRFNQQIDEFEGAQQALDEKLANLGVALAQLQSEETALQPLLAAKQGGRWWTGAWWRATLTGNLSGRRGDLEKRRAETTAARVAVAQDLDKLTERRRQAEAAFAAERDTLIAAESERRRHEWAAQVTTIEKEQAPFVAAWRSLCNTLDRENAPVELTPFAIAAARAQWQQAHERDEAACIFAKQWASFLQESAPAFVAQLPRHASPLTGTLNALTKNAEFAAFADGPFDLVVIADADRLLENDLLRLAAKGRRWLLVGHASPTGNGRSCTFDKIWQTLHTDPASRLAYRWCQEGNRWCCQLRPIAAKDRPYLETERLADFPEIELRILSLPKTQPLLAQVVFPATMSLHAAKQFIFRELQEAAVQPAGRGVWLEERADVWALHLGAAAHVDLSAVELEVGVREWAAPNGPTHRLDFDKSVWQRAQVDQWIMRYLNLRDLGRTFELA
jgi:hypothetical protein